MDRAVYDKILLDHAMDMGCQVFEQSKVDRVRVEGDRVIGLNVTSPDKGSREVTARYYVDCSGAAGLLRRKLGVEIQSPTSLRNIAIWDYWQNADWAINIGTGGTRIQVLSLSWGWLWFIPISPTRTSIGLVTPAKTFKSEGLSTEDLYARAVKEEPRIAKLIQNARPEGRLSTTSDWSFVAERLAGENWFLAGDSCGFADPILSAGMTLAHTGARRVAYSILELERETHDPQWIKSQYDIHHRSQIGHHIRFADFWYSSNGCFTDLKENCAEIAKSAGLLLNADDAFRWLSTGGFASENHNQARAGTYRLAAIKTFTQILTDDQVDWNISRFNEFRLNLAGAVKSEFAILKNGSIARATCLRRGDKTWPLEGMYGLVFSALQTERDALRIVQRIAHKLKLSGGDAAVKPGLALAYEVVEALIVEGWLTAGVNKKRPMLDVIPKVQVPLPDPYATISPL